MASNVNNVLPAQVDSEPEPLSNEEIVSAIVDGFKPFAIAYRDGEFLETKLPEVTIYQLLLAMAGMVVGYAKDWQAKHLARENEIIGRFINADFCAQSGRKFSLIELLETALDICGDFGDADFASCTYERIYSYPKRGNWNPDYYLTRKEEVLALGEVTHFVLLLKLFRTNSSRIIQMVTGGKYKLPTIEECPNLFYTIEIDGKQIAKKKTQKFVEFMSRWLEIADMLEGFKKDLSDVVSIFKDASTLATREIEEKRESKIKRGQSGGKAWAPSNDRRQIKIVKSEKPVPKPQPQVVRPPLPPPPKDCWAGKFNPVTGSEIEIKTFPDPVPVSVPVPVLEQVSEPDFNPAEFQKVRCSRPKAAHQFRQKQPQNTSKMMFALLDIDP